MLCWDSDVQRAETMTVEGLQASLFELAECWAEETIKEQVGLQVGPPQFKLLRPSHSPTSECKLSTVNF